MSLSLYVLAGIFRTRPEASEAALKYFLLGAFASRLLPVRHRAPLRRDRDDQPRPHRRRAGGAGAARDPMLLRRARRCSSSGFGFKISAVPFHMWAPDVYEGAPTPVTALIATGSRPRPSRRSCACC